MTQTRTEAETATTERVLRELGYPAPFDTHGLSDDEFYALHDQAPYLLGD